MTCARAHRPHTSMVSSVMVGGSLIRVAPCTDPSVLFRNCHRPHSSVAFAPGPARRKRERRRKKKREQRTLVRETRRCMTTARLHFFFFFSPPSWRCERRKGKQARRTCAADAMRAAGGDNNDVGEVRGVVHFELRVGLSGLIHRQARLRHEAQHLQVRLEPLPLERAGPHRHLPLPAQMSACGVRDRGLRAAMRVNAQEL